VTSRTAEPEILNSEFLSFFIQDKRIAVPISYCREVNKTIRITKVPHSRDFISGIVNLRGEIVVAVKLAQLLNFPANEQFMISEEEMQLVRLQFDNENLILCIDKVEDIISIQESEIEPANGRFDEALNEVIDQVGYYEDQMVLLLNPHKLFSKMKEKKK
jgi:purine-binding chemotaxis protein CheW